MPLLHLAQNIIIPSYIVYLIITLIAFSEFRILLLLLLLLLREAPQMAEPRSRVYGHSELVTGEIWCFFEAWACPVGPGHCVALELNSS